jgi:hypothetical protein
MGDGSVVDYIHRRGGVYVFTGSIASVFRLECGCFIDNPITENSVDSLQKGIFSLF